MIRSSRCALAAAAASDAAPAVSNNGVLATPAGATLYTFDKDAPGKSNCNGQCAVNWPPLKAESGAAASGSWSTVRRDDGAEQWAYKGKPLYTWVKDQKAGDTTGEAVNKTWHVARP